MKGRETGGGPGSSLHSPDSLALDAEELGWQPVGLRRRPEPASERAQARKGEPQRRREERIGAALRVTTTFVDPTRDPHTREVCYQTSDEDRALNLSRRGLALRCARPPEVGTRLLLEIDAPGEPRPIGLVGRARWVRVEYAPGNQGARASAVVGLELMGGSARALSRYEHWLESLPRRNMNLAVPKAKG